MKNFDCVVTLGDSWSWGTDLPEEKRISDRFDNLLAKQFGVESINLARESASNFCYKWHWIDWLSINPGYTNPLVIVGITGPNRHLIYNNQADFFQEAPGRLISEKMVLENWGNGPNTGGFIRAFPNYVDFPNAIKKQCQQNFYRYNYDDKMAEIYTIWEIKLLNSMIREYGGQPIFWSNFHAYTQINLPWTNQILNNCKLVNNLQPLNFDKECFFKLKNHPNIHGHLHIMKVLDQFIKG